MLLKYLLSSTASLWLLLFSVTFCVVICILERGKPNGILNMKNTHICIKGAIQSTLVSATIYLANVNVCPATIHWVRRDERCRAAWWHLSSTHRYKMMRWSICDRNTSKQSPREYSWRIHTFMKGAIPCTLQTLVSATANVIICPHFRVCRKWKV